MKRPRPPLLTRRDLEAIDSALAEKLAGILDDDIPREHYEAAHDKVGRLLRRLS